MRKGKLNLWVKIQILMVYILKQTEVQGIQRKDLKCWILIAEAETQSRQEASSMCSTSLQNPGLNHPKSFPLI